MDLLSRLDLFRIGRDYIESRNLDLSPGIADVQGSDANLFVGSTSFMGKAVVDQIADRTAALLLSTAEGEDLDRWGWDRAQTPRLGASPALGDVRFFRTTAAAGAGTIPIGQVLGSLSGPQYLTTSTATFGATDLEAMATVRALKAGPAFQVGRNQIRSITAQPQPIFDAKIAVTNDEPTAGGSPRESAEDYRQRLRAAKKASARGTLPAIEFGARQVPGVASAQALDALDPFGRPARVVQLFVADGSGVASRALGLAVQQGVFDWRAGGIAVVVDTSSPQLVSVELQLSFLASAQGTDALSEQIRASVVGFVNSLGVNQTLYRGDLQALLRRYARVGLVPNQSSVVSPTGDLVPDVGRTLRTTSTRVTLQ